MSLTAGDRLGPYEITGELGAGGMGIVLRARDTKLDRDVALKVLPEAFTSDPDRLARFEREAKVLASLNHPNIGTIYGLEEADGVKALVLELVEGPTLADRIKQGPIPLDEALPIAKQIAEALEAAHEQGVIHRDLKPANVKVREDGTVKVLDFGLAKAFQPDSSASSLSASPTISLTAAATRMGMVIGTAAYMSPEQARGKAVDKRADIWAFGAVIYEMLTGQQAFGGDDLSQTLARVIEREPDWAALGDRVPPVMTLFLRRCLDKDRRQRIHDVADVRLALDGAFETVADSTPLTGRAALPWGIATIAVVGLVAALSVLAGREPPAASPVEFTIEMPERASFRVHSGSLAISPDGSHVVFPVGRGPTAQLYMRRLDRLETAEPVRGTDGGRVPFFSSDGAWLGFFAAGQMKKVSVDGGTALPVAAAPHWYGASWGDKGSIVYAPTFFSPLWRVDADGGEPRPLTTLEPDEQGHIWPQLLPGERAVLFTVYRADGPTIEAYALDTGQRHAILDGAFARYVSTGHLLFVRNTALLAVPFDLGGLATSGAAVPVIDDVAFSGAEAGSQYAVSDDGALVYLTNATMNPPLVLESVDRSGQAEPLFEPDLFTELNVSPDGGRIAVSLRDTGGGQDVWVLDLERETQTRVTGESGTELSIVWTRDATDLILSHEGALGWAAARMAADGSGELEPLLAGDLADVLPSSLGPDGQVLAYTLGTPASDDIWTVPLDAPSDPTPFLETAADEGQPAFSPDGKWIAYQSNDSGRFEIYVGPFPAHDRRITVSTDGGSEPVWSPDGQELFYRPLDEDGVMVARVRGTAPELAFDASEQLFKGHYNRHQFATGALRNYDVMPDGERFIMVRPADTGRPRMNVVLNWFEELKARVRVQ